MVLQYEFHCEECQKALATCEDDGLKFSDERTISVDESAATIISAGICGEYNPTLEGLRNPGYMFGVLVRCLSCSTINTLKLYRFQHTDEPLFQ